MLDLARVWRLLALRARPQSRGFHICRARKPNHCNCNVLVSACILPVVICLSQRLSHAPYTSSASIRGSCGFRARLATCAHARPQSATQLQHKCLMRASSAQVLPRAARQHAHSTSPVQNRSLSWIAALPERRVRRPWPPPVCSRSALQLPNSA